MRYLVTGATGFVGSHIVECLVARGDVVRALVPPHESAGPLHERGVEVWVGDLTGSEDLVDAVASADVVVHCAAVVRLAASRRDLWELNVGGTERLLAASAEAGLSRFVYLSSVAVYEYAPPPLTEDAPKRPVGAYGESKWAAERALWRYCAERELPAVALRPCFIYGPRDGHTWPILRRLFQMRIIPMSEGGRRVLDLVYVSDVVDAVLAAATKPAAVGHAYNITDGESHTWRDIVATYGQTTGQGPTILPVPGWALMLILEVALRLRHLMRASSERTDRLRQLRLLDLDAHYAIDAACRDLGYTPQVGFAEGLRRTLTWDTMNSVQGRGIG
jgi:nucleoside-diphosphate-sugar epimerase